MEAIIAHEADVRRGDDEAVHKMRVATRRLRSALATFRPCLDRAATDPIRDELKWFGAQLGLLRDDHVMLLRLDAELAEVPGELVLGPVVEQIRMELRGAAQEHLAEVVAALDGDRFVDLLDSLHRLVEAPHRGWESEAAAMCAGPRCGARRERPSAACAGVCPTTGRLAIRSCTSCARPPSGRAYALEVIAPLEGRRATEAAARFEAVQELLGDHQDSVVARQLLRRMGASAVAGPRTASPSACSTRSSTGGPRPRGGSGPPSCTTPCATSTSTGWTTDRRQPARPRPRRSGGRAVADEWQWLSGSGRRSAAGRTT